MYVCMYVCMYVQGLGQKPPEYEGLIQPLTAKYIGSSRQGKKTVERHAMHSEAALDHLARGN